MTHSTAQTISEAGLSRRVSIPLFVLLVLGALPALLFAPLGVGVSVLALVGVIGAAVAFSRVKIVAGDTGLSARCMGIFHVSFAWDEILSVQEGPETGVLEGAGYRILPGGKVGLLVGGPSVEVRDSGKTYLLSVRDSQQTVEEIRRHLAAANSLP
ncbi:hypothetical protein ACHABQ_00690 [Nesterenkonia aurantiaca]|uniref:hypothetical protein n=1 Tax=Nesterenkonia aurantiaca TaxID=1436010 RepID=UPI003EE4CE73